MRDAISLLGQLLSYDDETLTLARVESVLGIVDSHTIGRLVDLMAAGDAGAGLSLINELVVEGVELGELVDQIVAYLRGVLFVSVTRAPALLDVPHDIAAAMDRQAGILSPGTLLNAMREFIGARALLRDQVPGVPQLPIELAFMRAVLPAGEPAQRTSGGFEPAPGTSPAEHRPISQIVSAPSTRTALATPSRSEPVRETKGSPAENGPGTTAAPPAPATATGAEPRDVARANWDRFLAMAGKRCGMKVQAALRSVREMDGTGGTLVLYFAHTFSRDLVDQMSNRTQVEALWEELLGRRVEVRCAVIGENSAPRASVPSQRTSRAGSEGDDDVLLHEAQKLGDVVRPLD
jgi:DNA polymerase III gamma/tau subunit